MTSFKVQEYDKIFVYIDAFTIYIVDNNKMIYCTVTRIVEENKELFSKLNIPMPTMLLARYKKKQE